MVLYKDRISFQERSSESKRITEKFPGRIPVIVERSPRDKLVPNLDKEKFLVPGDLTTAQFIYIIRKRLTLPSETALFLFVNGVLPTTATLIRELYGMYKDHDGFLYAQYSGENTFGYALGAEGAGFEGGTLTGSDVGAEGFTVSKEDSTGGAEGFTLSGSGVIL